MMNKLVMFSGASAVGKTAVIKALIPYLRRAGIAPCVCKIDCLQSDDGDTYRQMNTPCVVGLSQDICPDHFLVSNLPELWVWTREKGGDLLLIETAGLCHRCTPATEKTISVCVLDCTSSSRSPQKLGPMLTQADMVVLTKIDMVSQAEREIITWNLQMLNDRAEIFPVDGVVGYGVELLGRKILAMPPIVDYENDLLRHPMPSGVCSYCVGECRVGSAFQQGIVGKIAFGGDGSCGN